MTDEEWLAKAQAEGGVYEAFEYGLSDNHLDKDSDIINNVKLAYHHWCEARESVEWLENLMEDCEW